MKPIPDRCNSYLQAPSSYSANKMMMCSMPLLKYRETEGATDQQNAIDKAKGIICKPMPKTWYDWHSAKNIESAKDREFYLNIIADKKPYFMIYIYPSLKKQYTSYIKSAERNALREFGVSIDELTALPKTTSSIIIF